VRGDRGYGGAQDLEEDRGNYESQYALMVKQLARKDEKLEAAEKENGDLDSKNVELDRQQAARMATSRPRPSSSSESELSYRKCEMCVGHGDNYKWLSDRYDEELDENMQQDQQIVELEEKNEKLKAVKDQMAMMATWRRGVLWRDSVVI
jgi:DNA repair exonuclease SbcCD ATPase subunit